ncbi:hypothetical protein EC95NR1_B0072 (plasmid) [Escherichia coli]|nr:hypothetical protein EC95JB1_B0003 [Escherichia coli]ART20042.1 hypothetical protein EC95JB1_B0073 [Escherichia coli]ART27906.1 hypothetical protein EC95NR1_B0004 [Escherichia coli]ART27972.1 hypothetical protein EC95NR1_B0072 [Escherichia coli]
MIPLPSGTKIWLVAGITDMRKWLQRPGCESTDGAERRSHVRPCFHFPGPQRQSG